MNTRQLAIVGYQIAPKRFQGVFPVDKIPVEQPQCLIFNADPSHKKGQHWMAIFEKYFFDSYAGEPPSKDLIPVIQTPVQSIGTTTCGQHCLYFLHCYCNRIPLVYADNTIKNDKKVTKWLCEKYDLHTDALDIDYLYSQFATEYHPSFK